MSSFENGNSGQKLKFLNENQIVKIFPDLERPQNQIKKQQQFNLSCCSILPISTFAHNGFIYGLMEYVPNEINHILNNHKSIFQKFLIDYFSELKSRNSIVVNVKEKILEKLQSLEKYVDPNEYSLLMSSLGSKEIFNVPSSEESYSCHGDFTLSNILFKNDKVILIDCLDSFLESFLTDYCKIHQDLTFNYWKHKQIVDPIFSIDLKEIERLLCENFGEYINQYKYEYHVLNLLTIYRIFPYANSSLTSKLKLETKDYIQQYKHAF